MSEAAQPRFFPLFPLSPYDLSITDSPPTFDLPVAGCFSQIAGAAAHKMLQIGRWYPHIQTSDR